MKIFFVLAILALISCDSPEANNQKAEKYYQYTYMLFEQVNELGIQEMKRMIKENKPKSGESINECSLKMVLILEETMPQIIELFEQFKEETIEVIKNNYTDAELDQINSFYENTKMGRYISSSEGFAELEKKLEQAGYKEEIEKDTESLTSEQKYLLLLEYAQKILSEKDSKEYVEFKESKLGQELFVLQDEVLAKQLLGVQPPIMQKMSDLSVKMADEVTKISKTCD